jgi:hypothetical protein
MKSLSMKNIVVWHVIQCSRVAYYQGFQEKFFLVKVEENRGRSFSWPAGKFLLDHTRSRLSKQYYSLELLFYTFVYTDENFYQEKCQIRRACLCIWCKEDMRMRDSNCLGNNSIFHIHRIPQGRDIVVMSSGKCRSFSPISSVLMNSSDLWNLTACKLLKLHWRFREHSCFHY